MFLRSSSLWWNDLGSSGFPHFPELPSILPRKHFMPVDHHCPREPLLDLCIREHTDWRLQRQCHHSRLQHHRFIQIEQPTDDLFNVNDLLIFFEGDVILTACGNRLFPARETSANEAVVEFRSNAFNQSSGFKMNFFSIYEGWHFICACSPL